MDHPQGDAPALDVDDVKRQRRVSTSSMDDLFLLWIQAAQSLFEEYTGRQLTTAFWEYALDGFPSQRVIELPRPPLQSVVSVVYLDAGDAEQTLDAENYTVITPTGPHCRRGRIELTSGASWPSAGTQSRAVRITYVAGYADDAAGVPSLIKACLLYVVGSFHKYGEEVVGGTEANTMQTIPLGADTMLRGFKYSALSSVEPCQD
jgi:uncharacterized phiE125 gp8 family phage protein